MPVHVVYRNGGIETYREANAVDVASSQGVTTYKVLRSEQQTPNVIALVPAELVRSIHTEEPEKRKRR